MTGPSSAAPWRVEGLWRYPVKSLRGEPLERASLGPHSVPGDRLVHVAGDRGLLTGRTRHGLLTLDATTGHDGRPYVHGDRWDSPAAAAAVRAAAGPDARLVEDSSASRFDILPLLVLVQADAEALGIDLRRLRPNIVLTGPPAGSEREWPGQALQLGGALLGVHAVRPRCIVTTIDPDSGAQDLDVLRRIRRQRAGALALDCWVLREGRVQVGDNVELVPLPPAVRPPAGGWVTGAPYPGNPPEGDGRSGG